MISDRTGGEFPWVQVLNGMQTLLRIKTVYFWLQLKEQTLTTLVFGGKFKPHQEIAAQKCGCD